MKFKSKQRLHNPAGDDTETLLSLWLHAHLSSSRVEFLMAARGRRQLKRHSQKGKVKNVTTAKLAHLSRSLHTHHDHTNLSRNKNRTTLLSRNLGSFKWAKKGNIRPFYESTAIWYLFENLIEPIIFQHSSPVFFPNQLLSLLTSDCFWTLSNYKGFEDTRPTWMKAGLKKPSSTKNQARHRRRRLFRFHIRAVQRRTSLGTPLFWGCLGQTRLYQHQINLVQVHQKHKWWNIFALYGRFQLTFTQPLFLWTASLIADTFSKRKVLVCDTQPLPSFWGNCLAFY